MNQAPAPFKVSLPLAICWGSLLLNLAVYGAYFASFFTGTKNKTLFAIFLLIALVQTLAGVIAAVDGYRNNGTARVVFGALGALGAPLGVMLGWWVSDTF